MKAWDSRFRVEIDKVERDEWDCLLNQFDDATIYQSWSYGAVRWGENQLSHIVMSENGEVRAAAQARIMMIPGLGRGIAYVPFGPIWRQGGGRQDCECFRHIVRALHEEYVVKRGLLLRLLPNEWDGEEADVRSVLRETGMERQDSVRPYRTFLLDLSLPMDTLRKSLDPKWRGHLNRSGRNGLTFIEGKDDSLYATFAKIYGDMHSRKMFAEFVDIDEIREVQKKLPERLKMTVFVALKESEPVAALVCSAIGRTAVYFLGASNNRGRKMAAAYALQWAMIERLKKRGYRWYDLGGTDPLKNPGTHSFKKGLAGKAGREIFSIGQYDGCQSLMSSLFVRLGDGFRGAVAKRRTHSARSAKKITS